MGGGQKTEGMLGPGQAAWVYKQPFSIVCEPEANVQAPSSLEAGVGRGSGLSPEQQSLAGLLSDDVKLVVMSQRP